jgi:hypothetical protein
MEDYNRKYREIMNIRTCRNFVQIIGEHAVYMCELSKSEKLNNKRGLMENWVNIYKLNVEWTQRICAKERSDSDFYKGTYKLIKYFSYCLADYILDKRGTDEWKKRMDYIVQKEIDFFNTIAKHNQNVQKQWLAYTACIIAMTNASTMDMYYVEATDVLKTAICLGQWMDHSLS